MYFSNIFMLMPVFVLFRNCYFYLKFKAMLKDSNPAAERWNFNGRPNKSARNNVKGSDVDLQAIMPFYKIEKDDEGRDVVVMNDEINREMPKVGPKGVRKTKTVWNAHHRGQHASIVYTGPVSYAPAGRSGGSFATAPLILAPCAAVRGRVP